MKLTIAKLNPQDNLKLMRGLIHFDNPVCNVTIKDGNMDNNIIKLVKYLHEFDHFSLPEKQGDDLVYRCWNNEQVNSVIRYLISLEKEVKNVSIAY